MSNLTTYKFLFTAYLGQFNLNAKVSCPIHATWKRSTTLFTQAGNPLPPLK